MSDFDVIVVGAGVEGSATAYQLINNGAKRVLLLEQFSAINSRGSSHGSSRIIRRAHIMPYYRAMMNEAYRIWEEVERKCGTQLLVRTGMLIFGPEGSEELKMKSKILSRRDRSCPIFSASEAHQRYPHLFKLPSHYQCVFDEDGGVLMATKCLEAFQKLFTNLGGVLKDYHKVIDIIPGNVVTVKTTNGDFTAKKVVITAGPWTPKIMSQLGVELPVVITRAEIPYWRVENPEHFSVGSMPVFKETTTKDEKDLHQFFTGIPIIEYPGLLKVAMHAGPVVDPDHRDEKTHPRSIDSVSNFISRRLKGVSTTPSICEPCMYAESPDEEPIIDIHPLHSNIIYATGFSGSGFQKSPVIGKILMELSLDRTPSYDCRPFKLNRFNKVKSKL